tara:strand:+ start:57 stop:506 length:450 start_codon:yes stop_codon:yes gene_type:complete
MALYKSNNTSAPGQEASSEIQPWGLEFLRFDQLLKAADDLAIQVRMYNDQAIHQYWVILEQLYIIMYPYMEWGSRKFWDDMNETIYKKHDEWEEDDSNGVKEFPKELIKELTNYHRQLLVTKQMLGLGIPLSRSIGTKGKMKNALLGNS